MIPAGSGQINLATAAAGVVAGTISSILVKNGFVATIDRSMLLRETLASGSLVAVGTALWPS